MVGTAVKQKAVFAGGRDNGYRANIGLIDTFSFRSRPEFLVTLVLFFSLDIFNAETRTWSSTSLAEPLDGGAAVAIGDCAYFYGGFFGRMFFCFSFFFAWLGSQVYPVLSAGGARSTIVVFNVTENQAHDSLLVLSKPRYYLGGVLYGADLLVAVGGFG
jgi:hypothetical protein